VLDFYSRIGIGQFEEIVHGSFIFDWGSPVSWNNQYDQIRHLLDGVKFNLIGMPFNASLGICGPDTPERAKIAYDIQQVVRHRLAWDREPKGGYTVDFDKPMQCSNLELPKIKENK